MEKIKVNEIVYCGNCDDEVSYELKKMLKKVTIRDLTFECEEIIPVCKNCGEEIWLWAVEKQNTYNSVNKYKELVGLLTSDEIKCIRKRRKLSQKDLAELLCIGEKDITRYENGAIQTRAIDLMIRMVDDDKLYLGMNNIVEKYRLRLNLKTN